MAKSRANLKLELSHKNPYWTEAELELYISGYYDGMMEYMKLMDQIKQSEYDAVLEYQKQKK